MKTQLASIVLGTYIAIACVPLDCSAEQPSFFSQLGVNLAGAEFGSNRKSFSNENPGRYAKDYVYPCKKTMEYFVSNDIKLFRIPFRWERIQPQLGQPLDQEELKKLQAAASDAATLGAFVILDLHNYARYRTKKNGKAVVHVVGDKSLGSKPTVTVNDLCDLWQRLARKFRHHPSVVGYGIMNEPHDMPDTGPSWHTISRAVVDAIREVDPETTILVAGDRWSSARFFPQANGPIPWIDPNVPNIVYEAHIYFDKKGSGNYPFAFEKLLQKNPKLSQSGSEYVQPFLNWCARNKVQGFIGEFGIPSDPGWLKVMDDFLSTIQTANVGGCYWAAGPWWGDYPLSIQPKKKTLEDKPQMGILKRHIHP